ncbi:MAG: diacylglycerol kinase family lipid kinase [Tissierellaceae bacterium]|nr:diacylglycerol kinase family lipid kinase [Tissierellaceae bacterium]
MDNILFIVNPVAGGGKAKDLIPLIRETMDRYKKHYDIVLTRKPKEAIVIAEGKAEEYEAVVAVGGDGTVNEVSKGLINKGKGTLGILPGGTGNDMARTLGIPNNPVEAMEILNKGYKKFIDVGNVNGHKFINISSIGFDAEVVANNVNIKRIVKSGISYAISVIYTLFSFKNKKVTITIGDKLIEEEIILLAIGNGRYYGGGMSILPMAIVDDGLFHICVVSKIGKLKLLYLFPTIFKGTHIKYTEYVRIYQGNRIKVSFENPLHLNIDGELTSVEGEIEFSLERNKLEVIYGK